MSSVELGLERFADELQGVAQPLGGDPQLVQSRDVSPSDRTVERPDRLVGGPRDRGRARPDGGRSMREDRLGRRAGRRHQSLVVG